MRHGMAISVIGSAWSILNIVKPTEAKMLKLLSIGIVALTAALTAEAYTIGAKDSKEPSAREVYSCGKVDEPIVMDGRLDENAWASAPTMPFVDIAKGTAPFYRSEAKMLWDDERLYVGFRFGEPDIRSYWAMDDAHLPDDFSLFGDRNECAIMRVDRFAKVFLDPDGDGSNYMEWQINALNNVFDSWYKQGFTDGKWGTRERFPHDSWKCPGLISATHIDGSINNPTDIDRGWSLEMSIPWKSLKPFTRGNCPPKDGDVWGAHLGRVFRDRIGGKNTYWTWPCLGVVNCHLPDRYGKLVFSDKFPKFDQFSAWGGKDDEDFVLPKFERFFAWGGKDDEDFIRRAADIGVTDMIGSPLTPRLVELCAKNHIKLYSVVTLGLSAAWKAHHPDLPVPFQELSDAEKLVLDKISGKTYQEDEPGRTGQPENWQVMPEQKTRIEAMGRENYKIQSAYAYGGEPDGKFFGGQGNRKFFGGQKEIMSIGALCFHHPEVNELAKEAVAKALAMNGVAGVAFDGIGYENYHCCHCPLSMKLYQEYCAKNTLKPCDESLNRFSLDTLVDFQNELVDYAKSIRPDAVTVNHIWPVFQPDPLYGNRLKVDYCAQTASWYTYWDPFRIASYSRIIKEDQNKHFPNVKGVAFIGYYDAAGSNYSFVQKSPQRVELELRSILRGGSRMLSMCGLNDLLANPDIAVVFKKFMGGAAAEQP